MYAYYCFAYCLKEPSNLYKTTLFFPEKMPGLKRKCTKISNESCIGKMVDYFELVDGTIKCKIVDCKTTLSRFTSFYLKRHLRAKHFSVFNKLFEVEVQDEIQQSINAFETKQNALHLVAVDGYPMSLLNKPAFRYLIQLQLDELAIHGHDITINRSLIVDDIEKTSNAVREHIKNELKSVPLLSLLLDIATKSTLSVLGVSVSFSRDDNVTSRALGVIQMTKRHTGDHIAELVQEILNSFDASIEKIYSVTTDNGSNMIKTTRSLNEMVNSLNTDESDNGANDSDVESDNENDNDMDENEASDERFSEIVSEFTHNLTIQNDYIAVITEIRCCAHTLQLAIHDSLERSNARRVLARAREMCKSLRSQVINIEFRRISPSTILPPLDVVTRWCSEFIMVNFSFPPDHGLRIFYYFIILRFEYGL